MTRAALLRGAALGALCAALVAALSLADPSFLGTEWLLEDPFHRAVAASHPPDPRIVVVAVSEEAMARLNLAGYGRPPYPRSVYAQVVRELQHAGAAVIAIDIAMSEEDVQHPESDREFAEVVRTAPVVLAVQPAAITASPGVPEAQTWEIAGPPSPLRGVVPSWFARAASIGSIRIASSAGTSLVPGTSVVHRYPIADRVAANRYVPSLAMETARLFLHAPRKGTWRGNVFEFDGRRVPIDDDRTFAIRWHRRPAEKRTARTAGFSYPVISLDKVLVAALAREDPASGIPEAQVAGLESQLRDKIVVIGYTAAGLLDLRPTPLSATAAGDEIHANAIDNLINGDFNRIAPRLPMVLIIMVASILFGALLSGIRDQAPAGMLVVASILGWVAAGYLALASGMIIPTVAGASSIALTFILITVVKFTAEQRQSLVLKRTFGRYVSPQILDHILAHPEKVELGGERRDLTILFSDIRGFTSISEASEPEEVVEMLNEYLTRMVEILLAHGGTLDKFIGDAVMGFWNAPAADPLHPEHAVHCAIEMIDETARLRARWEGEGKAALRIGIGINSGEAVVGNIGAEKVFGYTVIGDAVNLASRLEGKNKDYGTEIIVSEFTLARIGNAFETVYLDDVKVKGKENAVKIYEVIRPRIPGETPPAKPASH
ncbi:MAG: adenylate/guanylate cyclase domain-containing protein [Thermoanaerobaculia bacterium]